MNAFLAKIYALRFFDAFVLIYPLYAVMFVDHGVSPLQLSTIMTAWSAVTIMLHGPAGVAADHWSRRWILCLAQVARCGGFVVWLAFPSFWGFLGGLALWGVKSAFTTGTYEAVVYDELRSVGREGEYAKVIGRAHAIQAAGVLAASLGAAGAIRFGYPVVLWASVASGAVAATCAAILPRAPKLAEVHVGGFAAAVAEALRNRAVLGFMIPLLLATGLGGVLQDYGPVIVQDAGLSASQIALYMVALSAMKLIVSAFAHRWRKLPPGWFGYGFLAQAALLGLVAAFLTPVTAWLLIVTAGVFKTMEINLEARMQDASPSAVRATMGSLRALGSSAVFGGAVMGVGALAQAASYRLGLAALAGALAVCGAAVVLARAARSRLEASA
ncbi:MFS transporter [Phenylobacterium sp.]|jgi:MFS family permease|uniref:MFS transporter n=1 Tax=Phenylobacterium sp. TaxID=1871053 RepID=UPI002E307907|nr:MFS transporter [Phenylobacterium sp.]HEX2560233.1 MFS transporter [Phenylobacterium sp.]